MPDGGTISIDAFNEHRKAGWTCPLHYQHPPGRYAHIEVSDLGGGIAPDALTRIFEPFFSTKFQGRGLGLAAAQGIVRSHGGCLHADSRPEQGTTFHVFLPATDKPVDTSPADESIAPDCDETILYVDDEEVVRLTACRMLRRQGFEVIVAADGAEGLAAFRESAGKIDLVIFDINMPQLGGADFHEQLRAIDPAIKTIAASGYSESVALDSMDTSELSAFVQKPFTFSDLIRIVRNVLDDKPISRKSVPG
jgi:CheY-like chemotaxis protein